MEREHTFEDIDLAAGGLEAMVTALDVATLTGEAATRLVKRLVTAERVLATARSRAAKRATEANQWRHAGERSAASWLANLAGTTTGQAAAELETTKQLEGLPATQAARAAGKLSELQARELAGAATADPSAEAELLLHARRDDAAAFKRRCAEVRAAAEQDEAAARERIRRARRFRSWTDAEGAFCFAGRGRPEEGAALLAAMKSYQDSAAHTARRRGEHEAAEAYAYDGLMAMAHHDSQHRCKPGARDTSEAAGPGNTNNAGGVSGTIPPSNGDSTADATSSRDEVLAACFRPGPRAKLIVRIDHTALIRGHTLPGETCEIVGIGPISVATARELARDAFLTAAVMDGVDVKSVVHLGRSATAHQRTALEARGVVCAVPGCGFLHDLEIDHVDGWAITRRTQVDQLDWLCPFHHGQKTHASYRLAGPPGARTWHPPGEPDPDTN